jgi:hypothetical protein
MVVDKGKESSRQIHNMPGDINAQMIVIQPNFAI